MEPIPLSVFEAAVQVAGSALHHKNSLKQLLRGSGGGGVSANGAERYSDLTKYQMFRWDDLDRAGTPGRATEMMRHLLHGECDLGGLH